MVVPAQHAHVVDSYGGGIHAQLDRAGAAACPMRFHYAERDAHIPTAVVDQIRAAMPRVKLHVYPGALHGFNCWSRGTYQPAAAALAHGRSVAVLTQALHGA